MTYLTARKAVLDSIGRKERKLEVAFMLQGPGLYNVVGN